jgi:hypothetical protein
LHELLFRLGCEVTVHPTVDGTSSKPDFIARFAEGKEVVVEAVLATDISHQERKRTARLNALYDEINRKVVSPNFFLGFGQISNPDAVPSPRKLRKFIQRVISDIDPDVVSVAVRTGYPLPKWTYQDENGFEVEISAIPKTTDTRGNSSHRAIGAFPVEVRFGGSSPALKKAIKSKATKYGALERPFVVAVNATSKWGTNRDDVVEALFGGTGMDDNAYPVWNGPTGPQNRRISAVCVTTVWPWNVNCADLCLYHNPCAKLPCSDLRWRIPQAISTGCGIDWLEGSRSAELFQLPNDWPGERSSD